MKFNTFSHNLYTIHAKLRNENKAIWRQMNDKKKDKPKLWLISNSKLMTVNRKIYKHLTNNVSMSLCFVIWTWSTWLRLWSELMWCGTTTYWSFVRTVHTWTNWAGRIDNFARAFRNWVASGWSRTWSTTATFKWIEMERKTDTERERERDRWMDKEEESEMEYLESNCWSAVMFFF